MKKNKKDILKSPIECIKLCMVLGVKHKGEFTKRFSPPAQGMTLSGEVLEDKKELKRFLLNLGKFWIKEVDRFMEEYE